MIDTTLFGVDLPVGTYTKGDVIELKCIAGPNTVRSGRGAANLKMVNSGFLLGAGARSMWKISIKNSDWIDPLENISGQLSEPATLDVRSGCNNFGHNCPLTPNSGWTVTAECLDTVTTTIANSLYALIDVDYPQVASIINPENLQGFPTAIDHAIPNATLAGAGTLTTTGWFKQSVDYMKAGYVYALDKLESFSGLGFVGFVSLENAAGMGGLCRIVPVCSAVEAIKQTIDYASSITKGPMTIGTLLFSNSGSATNDDVLLIFDYVKRKL